MTKEDHAPLVVAFVSDLMFTTRIQNVIHGLGFQVQWIGQASDIDGEDSNEPVRPGEQLEGRAGNLFELITAWQPALLLFDLSNTAVPWRTWIPMLKSSAATRQFPILAYGPHTNVELMRVAKDAGADVVLARSRFTADMPNLLKQHAYIPDRDIIDSACGGPLAPLAAEGIAKFNRGDYYAAHDYLEEAWRQDQSAARDLYRAILQVGIAYYQVENGNYRGAVKMLLRVRQWLNYLPDVCRGVDVGQLRMEVSAVHETLVRLGPDRIDEFDGSLFKPILLSVI